MQQIILEEKSSALSNHLREPSFSSFIHWDGNICTINRIDLFTTLSLETFKSQYSFKEFVRDLKDWNLKFRLTKKTLKVKFPIIAKNERKRSRSNHKIFDKFNQIEDKQEELIKVLEKTQEKLRRAASIHTIITNEIRKSRERQVELLQVCEGEDVLKMLKNFMNC